MNAESPVWSELKVVERKLAGLVIATVAGVLFTPFVYREMRQFDDGERATLVLGDQLNALYEIAGPTGALIVMSLITVALAFATVGNFRKRAALIERMGQAAYIAAAKQQRIAERGINAIQDDDGRIPVRTIVLCVIGGIVIFLFIGIVNFGWFREYLQ